MSEEDKKSAEEKERMDAEEKEKEAKADADAGTKLDKILQCLDSLGKRMDAYDAKMDAEEKERKEKEKADAEEKGEEKELREEREGDKKDSKRKDGEEEEIKERGDPKEMKADKAKKDADEKEEKEEKEKMDRKDSDTVATMQSMLNRALEEIATLKAATPKQRSDDDINSLADIQLRADSIFASHGMKTPHPWSNEEPLAYRRRIATALKKHSSVWKNEDLGVIAMSSPTAFNMAEKQIYADAMIAVTGANNEVGVLREVRSRDPDTGHLIKKYYGDPVSWMGAFSGGRRLAKFNLSNRGH